MPRQCRAMSQFPVPVTDHTDPTCGVAKRTAPAEAAAWPTRVSEVSALLRKASEEAVPVVFRGARDGLSDGPVPPGGLIVNLARLDQIGPVRRNTPVGPLVEVQAGVPLEALRRALRKEAPDLFFAPDPLDISGSMGGLAACDASGARDFALGSLRTHVHAMTVVQLDGTVKTLTRGCDHSIDLFIGSRGTLGAIVALDVRLLPAPKVCWELVCFAPVEGRVLDVADALRTTVPAVSALQSFDGRMLDLLREHCAGDRRVQTSPPDAREGLYVELMAATEAEGERAAETVVEVIEGAGLSSDNAWFATDERERKRVADFRRAIPEAMKAMADRHERPRPGPATPLRHEERCRVEKGSHLGP